MRNLGFIGVQCEGEGLNPQACHSHTVWQVGRVLQCLAQGCNGIFCGMPIRLIPAAEGKLEVLPTVSVLHELDVVAWSMCSCRLCSGWMLVELKMLVTSWHFPCI